MCSPGVLESSSFSLEDVLAFCPVPGKLKSKEMSGLRESLDGFRQDFSRLVAAVEKLANLKG